MTHFQKYKDYKPSGVEWLGDVPRHWEVVKLKNLLQDGKEGIRIGPFGSAIKSDIIKDNGYKIYGQEHVIANNFQIGRKYIDESDFKRLANYELFQGDIVITMMGTAGKCKVVPNNIEKGIMDSHLIRIKTNFANVNPNYIALLINDSHYIFHQIKITSKGSIMEGLNSSIIKSLLIFLPPLEEQTAIAQYLDQKTAQLDTAIAQKQRMIELLKERRQILIHRAVTQGLDPSVKMKDSGVEWIGSVPEHWEILPLTKYASRIDYRGKTPEKVEEGIFLITTKNIKNGVIDYEISKEYVMEKQYHNIMSRGLPMEGDVLFTMEAPLGMSAVIDKTDVAIAQRIIKFSFCQKTFDSNFVNYSMQTDYFQKHLQKEATGSTAQGIKASKLHKLKLISPPIDEQKEIVKFIETANKKLATAIRLKESEIAKLKEYKGSLINSVVTGKVRVV